MSALKEIKIIKTCNQFPGTWVEVEGCSWPLVQETGKDKVDYFCRQVPPSKTLQQPHAVTLKEISHVYYLMLQLACLYSPARSMSKLAFL